VVVIVVIVVVRDKSEWVYSVAQRRAKRGEAIDR